MVEGRRPSTMPSHSSLPKGEQEGQVYQVNCCILFS